MTTTSTDDRVVLDDSRFARFARVEWWDQALLANAHVLVVGAGALGNEVIKNLALLGVGRLTIVDRDSIETSNLSRSVLFRDGDVGQPKARCAARAARDIYPQIDAHAIEGDVTADVGLGWFRAADVIVGALDNREARVFVNAAAARVQRPWIDGGIEVLQGIVRGFAPPQTACYECTMSEIDWQLINRRRSCSMLARRAIEHGGVPTTPTTASIIGAIQAQEVVKLLHKLPALVGSAFVFEGGAHSSYTVSYQIDPNCPWHDEPSPIERFSPSGSDTTLADLWSFAESRLGRVDEIELAREIVESLRCVARGREWAVMQAIDRVSESDARCASCGSDSTPSFLHAIKRTSPHLAKRISELPLPPRDIVWARTGDRFLGFELADGRGAA